MRLSHIPVVLIALASMNCHPGPVISTGPKQAVGGTIAGMVSTEANAAVIGRKVTAVETTTGAQFDATTGTNGGYTIKVPEGRYRLEIELQTGEVVTKQPPETRVNRSDLDPHHNFVIAVGRAGGAQQKPH